MEPSPHVAAECGGRGGRLGGAQPRLLKFGFFEGGKGGDFWSQKGANFNCHSK